MEFGMVWHGFDAVNARLAKMEADGERTSRLVLAKSAALLVHAAQDNFAGSHAKGEAHIGGDKPNIVTGYLRRSIRMGVLVRTGPMAYMTQVGPAAVYGRAIELGLAQRTDLKFPYFEPAVKETQPEMASINEDAWADWLGS